MADGLADGQRFLAQVDSNPMNVDGKKRDGKSRSNISLLRRSLVENDEAELFHMRGVNARSSSNT